MGHTYKTGYCFTEEAGIGNRLGKSMTLERGV